MNNFIFYIRSSFSGVYFNTIGIVVAKLLLLKDKLYNKYEDIGIKNCTVRY